MRKRDTRSLTARLPGGNQLMIALIIRKRQRLGIDDAQEAWLAAAMLNVGPARIR